MLRVNGFLGKFYIPAFLVRGVGGEGTKAVWLICKENFWDVFYR